VSAVEKSTGKSNSITIKNEKGRLSVDDIEKMVSDAEANAEADKAKMAKVEKRNELESYLYNARNSLREDKVKETLGASAAEAEDVVTKGLAWLDEHGDEEADVYETERKSIESKIQPIMMKLYASQMPAGGPEVPASNGPNVEEVD
jgi:L1 cell adhesion molecule like protein